MAIDTENKRRSALGWFVLPAPDGTIATADRQHKAWKYAGIAAAVAATGVVTTRLILTGVDNKSFTLHGVQSDGYDLVGVDSKQFVLTGA